MPCLICILLGETAANYELGHLVKHVAKRHPLEGIALSILGGLLISYFAPKVARAITV